MSSGDEVALHVEIATLRQTVKQLAADVINLQQQVLDRDGEILALKIMQTVWPTRFPDNPPPVSH